MDLEKIGSLMRESDTEIIHSTPDAYFEDRTDYPVTISESLYPSMVGCYTSQVRVKQKHRELENLYYTIIQPVLQPLKTPIFSGLFNI